MDNRMQMPPVSQMGPGGQMQSPQMNPAMIAQLMQQYAAQQGGQAFPTQQGGMQSAFPDQGMNMTGNLGMPGMGPGMPMPKPAMRPPEMPGGFPMPPGMGRLEQKPMMRPPGMGGMGGPETTVQAQPPRPQGPPPMRLPPGAGVWKNPATGKMMNQTPIFSGQVNPATQEPTTRPPETGGVMTGGPGGGSSGTMTKPKPMMGPASDTYQSPPIIAQPVPEKAPKGAPPWQQETQKKGLARAMTSRVTKSVSR